MKTATDLSPEIYHVYPVDDSGDHELMGTGCKCSPKVITLENGNQIIAHDAFDGRLGVEWANKILEKLSSDDKQMGS